METPTLHIIINILLGLATTTGVITAVAFAFNKATRNLGTCLGLTFAALSLAQSLTQGYSNFNNVHYWWITYLIAAVSLLMAIWSFIKLPERPQLNRVFWQQWKRVFWMLFGIMVVSGIVESLFI